jgi:transposase-like protein
MTYTDETKSSVMAALLTGQSVSKVASDYNIPAGTVKSWKSRQMNGCNPIGEVATEKKLEIGDLLIDYLRTNLTTLKKQSEVFQDEKWLKEQSASELAVLHGVIADKTIRLLEALANDEQSVTESKSNIS